MQDVKVVSQFERFDPICNKTVIFDAYYDNFEKEMFIVIKPNRLSVVFFYERLYIMLNKVYHYKKIKNTNAMMLLLVAKLQEDDENINRHDFTERLKEYFSPALTLI